MELCEFTLERYIQDETIPHLVSWQTHREEGLLTVFSSEVLRIADSILNGLIYIHDHGEVHRDLSPQNGSFFIPIKLTDSPFLFREQAVEDC